MAKPKTRKTRASVSAFLAAIEGDARRADAKRVLALMQRATREKPAMWGSPIVGFGPRKANLVVYIMPGFAKYDALLAKLGKHRIGKSCLYLGELAHVNESVLRDLVVRSVAAMRAKYGV